MCASQSPSHSDHIAAISELLPPASDNGAYSDESIRAMSLTGIPRPLLGISMFRHKYHGRDQDKSRIKTLPVKLSCCSW